MPFFNYLKIKKPVQILKKPLRRVFRFEKGLVETYYRIVAVKTSFEIKIRLLLWELKIKDSDK